MADREHTQLEVAGSFLRTKAQILSPGPNYRLKQKFGIVVRGIWIFTGRIDVYAEFDFNSCLLKATG